LYHDTPVKALGEAIYDIDGLTHQGTLETFWKDPGIVDKNLYERFRRYLIDKTQINGSLYTEVRNSDESGLNWPMALADEHFNESQVKNPATAEGEAGSIIVLEEHKKKAAVVGEQAEFETATKKVAV